MRRSWRKRRVGVGPGRVRRKKWHPSVKAEYVNPRERRNRERLRAAHGYRCDYCRWKPRLRSERRFLDVHELPSGGRRVACKWCHGLLSNGKRPGARRG